MQYFTPGNKHIEGEVYRVEMTLLTFDFITRSPNNDERLLTETLSASRVELSFCRPRVLLSH